MQLFFPHQLLKGEICWPLKGKTFCFLPVQGEMGETELSPLCNTLGLYNPPSPHTLCFWGLTHSLHQFIPARPAQGFHLAGKQFLVLQFFKTRGDENPPSHPFHQMQGIVWPVRRTDGEHLPRGGHRWCPTGEAAWG